MGELTERQVLVASALSELALCASLIVHLAVLSPNETLDDLTASTLRCLLVPALQGDCELQVRTTSTIARRDALNKAQRAFRRFIDQVQDYDVVPRELRAVLAGPSAALSNPMQRREAKIAQFKAERDLKARIADLSVARGRTGVNDPLAEDEDDEHERELVIAQIRLHYTRANAQLGSIDMELEVLAAMPMHDPANPPNTGEKKPEDADLSWRLDRLSTGLPRTGPVLSSQGRVLRPFTILPSATGQASLDARIRMQDSVYGPSHRLPTMTIDEYLEQEAARGNILSGGGAAGAAEQEHNSAREKERREMDNAEAEGVEEAEREREVRWISAFVVVRSGLMVRQIAWDAYKDEHRRGEGNRIGRG
jgi:hypothetical protein